MFTFSHTQNLVPSQTKLDDVIVKYAYYDNNTNKIYIDLLFSKPLKPQSKVVISGLLSLADGSIVNQSDLFEVQVNNSVTNVSVPTKTFVFDPTTQLVGVTIDLHKITYTLEGNTTQSIHTNQYKFIVSDIYQATTPFIVTMPGNSESVLFGNWRKLEVDQSQNIDGSEQQPMYIFSGQADKDDQHVLLPMLYQTDEPQDVSFVPPDRKLPLQPLPILDLDLPGSAPQQFLICPVDDGSTGCDCPPLNDSCYKITFDIDTEFGKLVGETERFVVQNNAFLVRGRAKLPDCTFGGEESWADIFFRYRCDNGDYQFEVEIISLCFECKSTISDFDVTDTNCNNGERRFQYKPDRCASGVIEIVRVDCTPDCQCKPTDNQCMVVEYDFTINKKRHQGKSHNTKFVNNSLHASFDVVDDTVCTSEYTDNYNVSIYFRCEDGKYYATIYVSGGCLYCVAEVSDSSIQIEDCDNKSFVLNVSQSHCFVGTLRIRPCSAGCPCPIPERCYKVNYNLQMDSGTKLVGTVEGVQYREGSLSWSGYIDSELSPNDCLTDRYIKTHGEFGCKDGSYSANIKVYNECFSCELNTDDFTIQQISCEEGKYRLVVGENKCVSGYIDLVECSDESVSVYKPCSCPLPDSLCYSLIYNITVAGVEFSGNIDRVYKYSDTLYVPVTYLGKATVNQDCQDVELFLVGQIACANDTYQYIFRIWNDICYECDIVPSNSSISVVDCNNKSFRIDINSECAFGYISLSQCSEQNPMCPHLDTSHCYHIVYNISWGNNSYAGRTPVLSMVDQSVYIMDYVIGEDVSCLQSARNTYLSLVIYCSDNHYMWSGLLYSDCSHQCFINPSNSTMTLLRSYPFRAKITPLSGACWSGELYFEDCLSDYISTQYSCCCPPPTQEYELVWDITAFGENCVGCRRGLYWDQSGCILYLHNNAPSECSNFTPFALWSYIQCLGQDSEYEFNLVMYPVGDQLACLLGNDDLDVTVSGCDASLPVIQATIKSGRCASGSFTVRPWSTCNPGGGGGGGGGGSQCCLIQSGTNYDVMYNITIYYLGMSYTYNGSLLATGQSGGNYTYINIDASPIGNLPPCLTGWPPSAAQMFFEFGLSTECVNNNTNIYYSGDVLSVCTSCPFDNTDSTLEILNCSGPTFRITVNKPCMQGTIVITPA